MATGALPSIPRCLAADLLTSMVHRQRSLIDNVTLLPFNLFVTWTLEPNGNEG